MQHNERIRIAIAAVGLGLLPVLFAPAVDGPHAVAAAQAPKVDNPHGDYREDCSLCHQASGWKPARVSRKFDHDKFLPLGGAHSAVECTQCHKSLDFGGVPTSCVDCHADVHNGELGTDCARCHGTRSFVDRNDQIRLHRLTRFPLTGVHVTLDCEVCHRLTAPGDLSYVNTAAECVSCHLDAYQATTQPDHETGGFSQECAFCHDQLAWSHAHFDHTLTAFPLTGAHAPLACADCHTGGVYSGLSKACVSCHQGDYDGTNNPNHAAAGFSTDCTTCHNTVGWTGANFNHSAFFPIAAGRHSNYNACSDCHTNPSSYAEFTCFSCHPHDDQIETDGHHQQVNGYAYVSTACYNCHPRGSK